MDLGLVSSGVGALTSMYSASVQGDIADLQIDTANKIRAGNRVVVEAENKRDAVITATQRWRQSVHNKRVFAAVANNQESGEVNFQRQMDVRATGNFAQNIRAAEQSGRQQAAAAASGVTGSVVDIIDSTSRLRQDMERTSSANVDRLLVSDHSKQMFAQQWATMDQMDYSLIMDNPRVQDFMVNPSSSDVSLFSGVSSKDISGIAKGLGATFSFKEPDGSLDAFLTLNNNFQD